jgi:multidrug efflux pump subunit AcrA (membrane-fusion protein)
MPTPRIKVRTIWIISAVLILGVTGWYYFFKIKPATQTTSSTATQTAVVQRGNLILSASGSGTLATQTDATFGFDTSGPVTQVLVKVGDQVEAGQVLAQLDNMLAQMKYQEAQQALQELYSAASVATIKKEIGAEQDVEFSARTWLEYLISPEVVEAEEKVASAEQQLAEAQAEAKANPSDAANQKVKESEATLTYLKEKLTQAWAYYENVYLPENFTQYERKGRTQVVVTYTDPYTGEIRPEIITPSPADIAKARNDLAQARATIKDDQVYLEVLNTGTIPAGATGARLNDLYNAQLAVKNAQSVLDATKLIAPISGTVTALDVTLGAQGNTSSAVTISQLNQPYVVDAYIDQTDWSMAKVGNKVNVTFTLLPDQSFPAAVTTVYPELVSSNNSSLVHVVVRLDQSISQDLPAGTGATVDVIGGEAQDVVLVPVGAIHKTDGGTYAVTTIQNGKQVEQNVELGLQNETYAEVKSGLETGTLVVTN